MAAILIFNMSDIMYRQASGRIEFLGVKNVGVGVKIVILCYSDTCEIEINGRHLGFQDGGYDVPKSQWQNRIPRCQKCGCRR